MKRSTTEEVRRAQGRRASVAPAAVVAMGALVALALFSAAPWATDPPQPQRPVAVKFPVMDAPVPIANAVDWSLIEVSEDPGPLAIAAYGP